MQQERGERERGRGEWLPVEIEVEIETEVENPLSHADSEPICSAKQLGDP